MNCSQDSRSQHDEREGRDGWTHVGRAAEDFARRVARDAGRFAERIQEHTSEFAHDMSREWRYARRRHRHGNREHAFRPDVAPGDVKRVFEDVRGLVVDVLEGIDELITSVFPAGKARDAARESDDRDDTEHGDDRTWEKVISNRDVDCSACGRPIAVGAPAYVCCDDDGVAYRCDTCGASAPGQAGNDPR